MVGYWQAVKITTTSYCLLLLAADNTRDSRLPVTGPDRWAASGPRAWDPSAHSGAHSYHYSGAHTAWPISDHVGISRFSNTALACITKTLRDSLTANQR